MTFRQPGETDLLGAPAAVADAAAKRRAAYHVAGQPDRGCVEAIGQCHPAALGFLAHRPDGEMLAQYRAAAVVHEPGGGTDFGIGIARDVLLDEVDKARVALEQTQELE